jgi:hypothetical protein
MSRPEYVPEEPLRLSPGVAEMLADPNHYRHSEMAVVDYTNSPPPDDDLLPSLAGSPEPEPPSRWARLRRAWRGEA